MIKVDRVLITGLENALYGMRLPKASHDKSDTICTVYDKNTGDLIKGVHINNITSSMIPLETEIGKNDLKLANNLVIAGSDHGKWLRQVQLSLLIEAPMTFWWDADTYKVATVKNSSSRMHKITSKELNENDFSWDNEDGKVVLDEFRENQLKHLNKLIKSYNDYNLLIEDNKSSIDYKKELIKSQKLVFERIIQDLPDSYNFRALWTGSCQTARNFYFARKNHKQKEMRELANIFANLENVGRFITTTETIK